MPEQDRWTVKQLAEAADLTESRIRQLLIGQDIKGEKYGTTRGGFWLVEDAEARRWLVSRDVVLDELD